MSVSLFVSDLHLCAERPEKLNLFEEFLHSATQTDTTLYILGDLFEAWAGDDDTTPPHETIIAALANYTGTGHMLYLMRGNRDYLMGHQFAEATGGVLLDDTSVISINGENVLLMHGDTLCTGDIGYQIFRRIVNNALSRALFLQIPYALRAKIWRNVRQATKRTAQRHQQLADVDQTTVESVMQRARAHRLIHGHTHRSGIHHFTLGGKEATRIVLADWIEGGNVLVADDRFRIVEINTYIRQTAKRAGLRHPTDNRNKTQQRQPHD